MASSGSTSDYTEPTTSAAELPCAGHDLAALAFELELQPINDVNQMYADAAALEGTAADIGDVEVQMRARLIQGDMLDRKGDVAGGAKIVWEVNRWAADIGNRPILARSHVLLSSTYHNLSDPAACLEHAVRALELLDDTSPPRVRALYLVKLGDALGWLGSFEAARERYLAAEQIVLSVGDDYRHLQLLNNLAYTECDAGQPERAWAVIERMRAIAASGGRPLDAIFLDTVACAQMALGRYADAVETIRSAVDVYESSTHQEADGLAELLLTLAEAERLVGDFAAAQRSLDRCRQTCAERGLTEVAVRAMEEQAALHAARGEFEHAYQLHIDFHAAAEEINSVQREALARTRQAMFETAEARQAAELFREQARRDSLTGLHNRRYVDEQLPLLLRQAASTGSPLSIGLVDLDHFKRVNDSLSHETGDQVLVVIAALLIAAVATSTPGAATDADAAAGFVARIGGEEFLVVFPSTALAECAQLCEEIRLAVRSHPWHAITGDLQQTVSIGVATTTDEVTQSALLRQADDNLYIAKRAGRDRVVADPRGRAVES
jgi:diguanylate cyclase (GGDEF)-like protein